MITIHDRLNEFIFNGITQADGDSDRGANERAQALDELVNPLIRLVDEWVVVSDAHWVSIELGLNTALGWSGEDGVETHYMTTQFAVAAYINSVAQ